ncbi:MAG TPA: hypothetical protein VLD61_11305 [Methylomirabilota bacterium]|nr:hypothetical protein [Methylomirabilota bacterium]
MMAMVWYGWLGLAVLVVNQALLPWQLEPLARWFTPTMWTAYILLADALVLARRGASLIHDQPREAAFMATVSIPLWLVFEAYNLRLTNWAYFGVPEHPGLAALAYAWSFATITPGLWQTAALLEAWDVFGRGRGPAVRPPAGWIRTGMVVGAVFLIVPPLLPAPVRPWTFGLVWLGFALLLDPWNDCRGRPSFLGAWMRGDRGLAYRWLLAGLLCGFLWEFWNYWALGRWRYVGVPVLPDWKAFEMPVVGYLGFPPFALEAFAMYHFVRPWAAGWLPPARSSPTG